MTVATWPGTTFGPVVQIGYETELGCEFEWDCAVWGGELPAADLFEPFNDFTTNPGWAPGSATIVAGRTGTAARTSGSGGAVAIYTIPAVDEDAVLTVGFAYQVSNLTTAAKIVCQLRTGTTVHTQVSVLTTGAVEVRLSTSTILGASPVGTITAGAWYYIELRVTLGDLPNGAVTLRVNETQHLNLTGIDTRNAGAKTVFDNFALSGPGSGTTNTFDDMYLSMGVDGELLGDITGTLSAARVPVENPGRWGPWWEWRNFECDVRAGSSIVRGTASPSQRPSSSTASLSLTPADETMAPWYVDPATGEQPNRGNLPLRVGVTNLVTEEEWWLFTGWIDYLTEVDSPDELSLTIVSSDGFKHLALLNQGEQAAQGAGEAAGSRINRILNRSEWRSTRELSPGTFALQATTLAQPALEEIFLVADTEGGVVWVDTSGAFRFGDRDWLREKAESTRWRVGDHQVDPDAICVASIVSTADDMDVQNVIGISRVGGTAAWLEDADSIAKYGRHSWSRFDLPYADDADTATILQFQLSDRAARDYHVQAVVLSPLVEPEAWELCTQVELFDTVYVTRRRGDAVLAETASVIGIDHSFGPGEFVTVLSLGPRIRQSLARWDFDLWDTARWSAT